MVTKAFKLNKACSVYRALVHPAGLAFKCERYGDHDDEWKDLLEGGRFGDAGFCDLLRRAEPASGW